MALFYINSRAVSPGRLKAFSFCSRRLSGSLCTICAPKRGVDALLDSKAAQNLRLDNSDGIIPCSCPSLVPYSFKDLSLTGYDEKNSYSLSENGSDSTETRISSVLNLQSLLEISPSKPANVSTQDTVPLDGLKFSLCAPSHVKNYPSAANIDNIVQHQQEIVRKLRSSLDGLHLDQIFGINNSEETAVKNDVVHHVEGSGDNCSGLDRRECMLQTPCNGKDFSSDSVSSKKPTEVEIIQADTTRDDGNLVVRPLTNISPENIVFCSGSTSTSVKRAEIGKDGGKPNLDELRLIQDHLNDYFPKCFSSRHNYRIYHQDVVFENYFAETPFVTRGINAYVREIAKYRIYAHFRYANVKMGILKSTIHEEDGSVRIRWRVSGIPQARAFMFWKFLPWKYKKAMNEESEWLDGMSTFYVQSKAGVVYKHKVDRVIPDEDLAAKVVKTGPLSVSGTA